MTPLSPSILNEIFARFEQANPTPKSDLIWTNPYTLLVAVVLSAQTTDKGVNKVTPALFEQAGTPAKMLAFGEDNLRTAIKSIGLYQNKAKNIITLSQQLIDRHNGQVPQTLDEMVNLAGVGRKTANVVLNVAFDQPTLAVDTHVFRLAHRLNLSTGKTPEQVEADLTALIPEHHRRRANHWLVLHGRYICTARAPKCATCPIADLCPWPEKTII